MAFYDDPNDPWFKNQFIKSVQPVRCYLNWQEKGSGDSNRSRERTKRKKMEMSIDPLEPSKLKQKRVSKPVPVVYLPPKKPVAVAKKEQDWTIPPCEFIWKYRSSIYDVQINDNFGKLTKTLKTAEEGAMKAISMRREMRKEKELRDHLAQKADECEENEDYEYDKEEIERMKIQELY